MSIESSSFRDQNNPYIPLQSDKKESISSSSKSIQTPKIPAIEDNNITPENIEIFLAAERNAKNNGSNQKLQNSKANHSIQSISAEKTKSAEANEKLSSIIKGEKTTEPKYVEGEPGLIDLEPKHDDPNAELVIDSETAKTLLSSEDLLDDEMVELQKEYDRLALEDSNKQALALQGQVLEKIGIDEKHKELVAKDKELSEKDKEVIEKNITLTKVVVPSTDKNNTLISQNRLQALAEPVIFNDDNQRIMNAIEAARKLELADDEVPADNSEPVVFINSEQAYSNNPIMRRAKPGETPDASRNLSTNALTISKKSKLYHMFLGNPNLELSYLNANGQIIKLGKIKAIASAEAISNVANRFFITLNASNNRFEQQRAEKAEAEKKRQIEKERNREFAIEQTKISYLKSQETIESEFLKSMTLELSVIMHSKPLPIVPLMNLRKTIERMEKLAQKEFEKHELIKEELEEDRLKKVNIIADGMKKLRLNHDITKFSEANGETTTTTSSMGTTIDERTVSISRDKVILGVTIRRMRRTDLSLLAPKLQDLNGNAFYGTAKHFFKSSTPQRV